jgi:hypothetical protein
VKTFTSDASASRGSPAKRRGSSVRLLAIGVAIVQLRTRIRVIFRVNALPADVMILQSDDSTTHIRPTVTNIAIEVEARSLDLALSVVMPVYNDEAAITRVVRDVQTHVLDVVANSELIVVDDGSSDRTAALLDDMAKTDPRICVLHQANQGHGGALINGMDAAVGERLLLVDSDGQIELDDFLTAWNAARAGQDAVFGVRRRRSDPVLRLGLSAMIRFALTILFGVSLRDPNAPYKLVRRSIWKDARTCIPPDTLAPSLFLAIFARWRGVSLLEMDVVHRARMSGESSSRRGRLLQFCTRAFQQLLAFRRRLRHGR